MKKQTNKNNKQIILQKKTRGRAIVVVAVSGGFDPVHVGHVRLFNEAKTLGDELVVILNNDNWLKVKKGEPFMSENERREILESFRAVDKVIITKHGSNDQDRSVCRELEKLRPQIFANGGDRYSGNIPEYALCERLGIEMIFNVGAGGKVQSSSWLIAKVAQVRRKS